MTSSGSLKSRSRLNIGVRSTFIGGRNLFSEFEILYAQLARQKPISSNELSALKAKVSDLAHAYCGTPVFLRYLKQKYVAGIALTVNVLFVINLVFFL